MSVHNPFSEAGKLVRIDIFPIKSLEGISVQQAEVLANGALKYDRQYTFWSSEKSKWIRAKAAPDLIRIRTDYDLDNGRITLKVDGTEEMFCFADPVRRAALGIWMSDFLNQEVELKQNDENGYFDDISLGRYGISLISTGTIARVCQWFPALTDEEVSRRMRMNVTVDGFSPLWEEWVIKAERNGKIKIGEVTFHDPWPCSRCLVPARDSYSALTDPEFVTKMTSHRNAETPENVPLQAISKRDDFDGFFTLGVRTDGRDPGSSNVITVGDVVTAF